MLRLGLRRLLTVLRCFFTTEEKSARLVGGYAHPSCVKVVIWIVGI